MTAKRQAILGGVLLAIAAVAVWLRDPQWQKSAVDTLPLAMGLPLVAFLGKPWRVAETPGKVAIGWWLAGFMIFAGGWTTGMLTPLAIGWTVLLGCWMLRCFEPLAGRLRLVWIGLFSFPWLVLDWPQIGWAFRLSAADFVSRVFTLLAMPVSRTGTSLEVVGLPVEVQEACAGWNLLQLCLLFGLAMAAMELRRNSRFAILLVILPIIAWLANAIRILLLAVIGLTWGTSVAAGPLHAPTALLVLALVMVVTRLVSGWLEPRRTVVRRVTA